MVIDTYKVCLIATHACGADTICKNVIITNIDTFNSIAPDSYTSDLSIWPNPTSNELYIQLPKKTPHQLVIHTYDLLGRLVLTNNSFSEDPIILSTDKLLPGSYFIELIQDGLVIGRARFIKH